MSKRHRSRRLALQALCCIDVQGEKSLDLVQEFIDDSDDPLETRLTARDFLQGALAERDLCDRLLKRHAKHWNLDRLALVDRNILRLAVCELRSGKVPKKVAINEALVLAQEFSTAESPRFVNGVLDAIARELETAEPPPPGEPAGHETK